MLSCFQYFVKTKKCKFGDRCKFNHPKDNAAHLVGSQAQLLFTSYEDSSIYFNG